MPTIVLPKDPEGKGLKTAAIALYALLLAGVAAVLGGAGDRTKSAGSHVEIQGPTHTSR